MNYSRSYQDPRFASFASPVQPAGPADFERTRQLFAKAHEEQDRKHRAEMRRIIGQMERRGPVMSAVSSAAWLGAGLGVLGLLLGPGKDGQPRALRWAGWGAFIGGGTSLLSYKFVEGMKPMFEEPRA
jgi:hypothetical protein